MQGQKRKNKPWDEIPSDELLDKFESTGERRPDLAERETCAQKTGHRKECAHKEVDPRKATKAGVQQCPKDYRADAENKENHLTRSGPENPAFFCGIIRPNPDLSKAMGGNMGNHGRLLGRLEAQRQAERSGDPSIVLDRASAVATVRVLPAERARVERRTLVSWASQRTTNE